jgi:hypothetical protein
VHHKSRLTFGALTFCALVLLPALLDRPVYQLALSPEQWVPDPSFFGHSKAGPRDLPGPIVRSPDFRLWSNYSVATGLAPGRLESLPFLLDKEELFVPVIGFPNSVYAGIYLESQLDQRRIWINAGAAHEEWQSAVVTVPSAMLHTPVRLVAYSSLNGIAVGVGTPYYRLNNPLPGLSFSKLFGSVAFSLCYLLVLFFPAFYLLKRGAALSAPENCMAAFVITAFCSLALFYLASCSPTLGRAIARLWLLAGAALLLAALRASRGKARAPGNTWLFVLVLLTVFQAFFVFSFSTVSPLYSANYLFYPAGWSTDNQIPLTVAQILASGSSLGQVTFGPWKVSDRTPLLACLLFPAVTLLRHFPHVISAGAERTALQMCSFGIQNSWVLPVWVVLRRLRFGQRECVVALLLLAGTPFIFFNTVYVWPKLLAATFCLIQFVYLGLMEKENSFSFFPIVISGVAAGLAVMSHGSAAIAVLAIYLVAIIGAFRARWPHVALSGAVSTAVIVPWLIWSKTVAPTINPLPRFLLTADFGFSAKAPRGVLEAALQMYGSMPFSAWLQAKFVALKTLAGFDLSIPRMALGPFKDPFLGFESVRAYQFFFLAPSLGLLLIPLAWIVLSRRALKAADPARWLFIRRLACAVILTFLLQFAVMMAPHLLHHYPYLLPLGLHLLAVVVIMGGNSRVLRAVAGANYILFVLYWIIFIVAKSPVQSMGGIVCSLLLLAAATFVIGKWAFGRALSVSTSLD